MTDPNTNEAYEAVLADLRAQRDQLDATIAVLERRLGMGVQVSSIPPQGAVGSPVVAVALLADAFFGMTLLDAIKKYLAAVKRPQSPKEIMDALERGGYAHTSKRFYGTVYNALTRAEGADLVKVKDDWGLREWYPNLRRAKGRQDDANGKAMPPDDANENDAE